MNFIIPIAKVDQERRLVIGRATEEKPDKTKEILDYATAKPAFESWSKQFEEMSGGMSKGNLRVMHGPVVAGKIMEMEFNDADKAVDIVAKVVDDNEWKKVQEGVYTGFSIGGGYAKRWKDGELTRYTPRIAEISLVDNPCLPSAKFYDLVKADGSVERREFPTPALGDRVEVLADQHGEGAILGSVVGLDDGRVLVKHADGQTWTDWPAMHVQHIERDGASKTWVMKRSPDDEVTAILAKYADIDHTAVAKAMRDFRAGTLTDESGRVIVDREKAMAKAVSAGRRRAIVDVPRSHGATPVLDPERARLNEVLMKWSGPVRYSRRLRKSREFDESKIKRDEDGKFDEKTGGGSDTSTKSGHKARIKSDEGYRAQNTQAINETRMKYAGAAAGFLGGGALAGGLTAAAIGSEKASAGIGRATTSALRRTGELGGKAVGAVVGGALRGAIGRPRDLATMVNAGATVGRGVGAAAAVGARAAGRGARGFLIRAAGSKGRAAALAGLAVGSYAGYKAAGPGYQAGTILDDFKVRRVEKADTIAIYGGLRKARVFNESDVVRDGEGKFTFKDGRGPASAGKAGLAGAAAGAVAGGALGVAAGKIVGRAEVRGQAGKAAQALGNLAAGMSPKSPAAKAAKAGLMDAVKSLTDLAGSGPAPKTLAAKVATVFEAARKFIVSDKTIAGVKGISRILARNPSLAITMAVVGAAGALKGKEMLSQIGSLISNSEVEVGIGLDGPTVKVKTRTDADKKAGKSGTVVGQITPAGGFEIARTSIEDAVGEFRDAFKGDDVDLIETDRGRGGASGSGAGSSSRASDTASSPLAPREPARQPDFVKAEMAAWETVRREPAYGTSQKARSDAVVTALATDKLDENGRNTVIRGLFARELGPERWDEVRKSPSKTVEYLNQKIDAYSPDRPNDAVYIKEAIRRINPGALKSLEVETPNGKKVSEYQRLMGDLDRKMKGSGPRDGDGDGKVNEGKEPGAGQGRRDFDNDDDGKSKESEQQRPSAPMPPRAPVAQNAPRPVGSVITPAPRPASRPMSEFEQTMDTVREHFGLDRKDWDQLGDDEKQNAYLRYMDSPSYRPAGKSFPSFGSLTLAKGHLIRPRRFSQAG